MFPDKFGELHAVASVIEFSGLGISSAPSRHSRIKKPPTVTVEIANPQADVHLLASQPPRQNIPVIP